MTDIEYSNRKIQMLELEASLKEVREKENADKLQEEINSLWEMATLRKFRSGLPVNIWVDDSLHYKKAGHGRRIKFQGDKGDSPNTLDMIPMTIADEPKIVGYKGEVKLSSSDINKIKSFIILNKDLLISLSDAKIDFGTFLDKFKKE